MRARESQGRGTCERELTESREQVEELQGQLEEERSSYGALKRKMMERCGGLEQEVVDLRDQLDGRDREVRRIKRELDKAKREALMLREEISIMGRPVPRFQSPAERRKSEEERTKGPLKVSEIEDHFAHSV